MYLLAKLDWGAGYAANWTAAGEVTHHYYAAPYTRRDSLAASEATSLITTLGRTSDGQNYRPKVKPIIALVYIALQRRGAWHGRRIDALGIGRKWHPLHINTTTSILPPPLPRHLCLFL